MATRFSSRSVHLSANHIFNLTRNHERLSMEQNAQNEKNLINVQLLPFNLHVVSFVLPYPLFNMWDNCEWKFLLDLCHATSWGLSVVVTVRRSPALSVNTVLCWEIYSIIISQNTECKRQALCSSCCSTEICRAGSLLYNTVCSCRVPRWNTRIVCEGKEC